MQLTSPPVTIRSMIPTAQRICRSVSHHDLRHRSRGQEAPRDPRDFPSRSGGAIFRSMSISCGSAKARPSGSAFPLHIRMRKPHPA